MSSSEAKRHKASSQGVKKNSASIGRIQSELWEILQEPPSNISATLKDDSDMTVWVATIDGPEGSPYEGGKFFLEIEFPSDYPFKPPKVKFTTRIYHCNVSPSGYICIDILKDQWSAALRVSSVLLSISSLMADPNPKDPLVPDIAAQFIKDKAKHDAEAREWTKRCAMGPSMGSSSSSS